MNKIKTISRCFKRFFQLIFVLLPIQFVWFWLSTEAWHQFLSSFGARKLSYLPASSVALNFPLDSSTIVLAAFVSSIPLALKLLGLIYLIRLFAQFESGKVFEIDNAYLIKRLAYVLFICQVMDLIRQALMTLIITMHNPPGQRMIAVGIGTEHLSTLLLATLILLISWIFTEGAKLYDEQQLTV